MRHEKSFTTGAVTATWRNREQIVDGVRRKNNDSSIWSWVRCKNFRVRHAGCPSKTSRYRIALTRSVLRQAWTYDVQWKTVSDQCGRAHNFWRIWAWGSPIKTKRFRATVGKRAEEWRTDSTEGHSSVIKECQEHIQSKTLQELSREADIEEDITSKECQTRRIVLTIIDESERILWTVS